MQTILRDRKYVLHPVADRRPAEIDGSVEQKPGAVESERIARLALKDPTIKVFGILCVAKDSKAKARTRQTYDDQTVFRLRVEEEGKSIVAHLVDRLDVSHLTNK